MAYTEFVLDKLTTLPPLRDCNAEGLVDILSFVAVSTELDFKNKLRTNPRQSVTCRLSFSNPKLGLRGKLLCMVSYHFIHIHFRFPRVLGSEATSGF